jgi:hypothetical protein
MADLFPDINEERRKLYIAVRYLLRERHGFDQNNNFPIDPTAFGVRFRNFLDAAAAPAAGGFGAVALALAQREIDELRQFLAVYGMLIADASTDPTLGRPWRGKPDSSGDLAITRGKAGTGGAPNDPEVLIAAGFIKSVTRINEEYNAQKELFDNALNIFRIKCTQPDGDHAIESRLFAEVVRRLVLQRTPPDDKLLDLKVSDSLSIAIGGKIDGVASAIDISLPELDVGTVVEILKDNVRAVGLIYFASQLEEMKLMAVADRIVDHFRTGMLPVSRGPGGDRIYAFLRDSDERFNEFERRGLYGRTFGLAQGAGSEVAPNREFVDLEVAPNREFLDLWIRFLSSVSTLQRQTTSLDGYGDLLREQNGLPPATNRRYLAEQAHKCARDLAVNLTLHGYGIAHFAAVELKKLVADIVDMLSSAEVTAAYGVRDMWQLVERVSTLYLGGAANGVRYRTTARAGADIMFWLADQAQFLGSVANPDPTELLKRFEQQALVSPVERWLAVTGTAAPVVQQYSQPIDAPTQPTIPNLTPSAFLPESVRGVMSTVGNLTGSLPGMNGVPGVLPQA